MTLSFSTKFPDKSPTFFVEKIWKGFDVYNNVPDDGYNAFFESGLMYDKYDFCKDALIDNPPKIHTIRADPKNRWREGMDIHFVINNRTKNRFQFAPILKVQKIQTLSIRWDESEHFIGKLTPSVFIDGSLFYGLEGKFDVGIKQLAKNDGFESEEKFFQWFNDDFDGILIHWTLFFYSFNPELRLASSIS